MKKLIVEVRIEQHFEDQDYDNEMTVMSKEGYADYMINAMRDIGGNVIHAKIEFDDGSIVSREIRREQVIEDEKTN